MNTSPDRLAHALRGTLGKWLNGDPAVRELLVALAHEILEQAKSSGSTPTVASAIQSVEAAAGEPAVRHAPVIHGPAVIDDRRAARRAYEPTDLAVVSRAMELKARASRYAAERRRKLAAGEDIRSLDDGSRPYFDEARNAGNVYLWMLDPYGPATAASESQLTLLAEAFDNAARAAGLVARLDQAHGEQRTAEQMPEAFRLLAESQSAVRAAVSAFADEFEDKDQKAAFFWLRRETEDRRIFVERHMKISDPADPANFAQLRERLINASNGTDLAPFARRPKVDDIAKLLNKARFHAKHLIDDKSTDDDWEKLVDCVDKLIEAGLMPADRRLVDLIRPLTRKLPPGELPRNIERILDVAAAQAANLDTDGVFLPD